MLFRSGGGAGGEYHGHIGAGTLPVPRTGGQAGGLSHPLVQNMPYRPGYYPGGRRP